MKPMLINVAEFLIVAALWALGGWILLKRVKSRKKRRWRHSASIRDEETKVALYLDPPSLHRRPRRN
jgi:hypothetical protein